MGFDIDHEWSKVQIKQRFEEVQLVDPSQPKAPDTCRFVCVSDTHARHDRMIMPEGDVLLHAGDFSSIGLMNDITRFSEWLRDLPYQHKVVIAGNHDIPRSRAISFGVFTDTILRNPTTQQKLRED